MVIKNSDNLIPTHAPNSFRKLYIKHQIEAERMNIFSRVGHRLVVGPNSPHWIHNSLVLMRSGRWVETILNCYSFYSLTLEYVALNCFEMAFTVKIPRVPTWLVFGPSIIISLQLKLVLFDFKFYLNLVKKYIKALLFEKRDQLTRNVKQ